SLLHSVEYFCPAIPLVLFADSLTTKSVSISNLLIARGAEADTIATNGGYWHIRQTRSMQRGFQPFLCFAGLVAADATGYVRVHISDYPRKYDSIGFA